MNNVINGPARELWLATIIVTMSGVGLPMSALAQSADEADDEELVEEVLVTGSRIKRQDLTSVGPMTVIDDTDIDNSGLSDVEVILQRLPASAGFAGNANAAYWVPGGWGTTQVNLRGLGVNRTLVLLNGRRMVYGGSGANDSVDLNMIPVSIISRMEVLKDGASAIYGADAVAGVVNFITKDSFDGLQLDAKYGQTSYSDGEEARLDLTWGVNSDKGSMIFAASYQDSTAAPLVDRAPCALADLTGTNTLECSPGSSATSGGRAAYVVVPPAPAEPQINFIGGDAFEPFDIQTHGFNSNPYFNASNPVERFTISTFGNYEIASNVRAFAEAMFNWRYSQQPASPATLRNIAFSATHPTNPTGRDILLIQRRTTEFGPRDFEQEVNTWRVVAGIEGDFLDDWNYDVALNWGRNSAIDSLLDNINIQRLAQTLDPVVCGTPTIPCADILGEGDLTADVGDYILVNQRDTGGNEQKSVTGNVSGPIFDLPAGSVGFAAGFEFREDSGWLYPDSLLTAGAALGNAQDPISGSIEATEVYGEVHVPLLTDVPMIAALDMDLALRYSDYDLFGSDTNYKVGMNWQIIESLKARGTYSTAFRAPSIPELFSGVREAQLPTVDPCSEWSALDPSSVVYQNCQAAGVPVNYEQFGDIIITDIGGNPNLQPEDATTFTVGLVFEPEFAPGLSLTVDYFDIDIEDSISQTGGSSKLSICYNSANLSHPFCGTDHHTRSALTGDVDFLSAQSANQGNETMSGMDFGATYDFEFSSIQNRIGLLASNLQEYEITAFAGDTPVVRDGNVGCCVGGYPEWRWYGNWVMSTERWGASYNLQVIGSATDPTGDPGAIGTDIDPVYYHSIQGSYIFNEDITLRIGIDNLFEEDAPYVNNWTDGNTDTMTYSLLGRFAYLRATYNIL